MMGEVTASRWVAIVMTYMEGDKRSGDRYSDGDNSDSARLKTILVSVGGDSAR